MRVDRASQDTCSASAPRTQPAESLRVDGPSPPRGTITVPPDKSVSHRAALLASAATGTTTVEGFLAADDCLRALTAIRQLGAGVDIHPQGPTRSTSCLRLAIHGVRGVWGGFREPGDVIDVGNSGTLIRLLLGLLAGHPGLTAVLTGDESIRRRPMGRVVEPLRRMGACIIGRARDTLAPLVVRGAPLSGITYEMPVASAQVKSALLLAGLTASGRTVVIESIPTRDHTERMLAMFGVRVGRHGHGGDAAEPGRPVAAAIDGPADLVAPEEPLVIPGDISSAAPFLAACAASGDPKAAICVRRVGVNPHRIGLLRVLEQMGAKVRISQQSWTWAGGEPVADVEVSPPDDGHLRGVEVPPVLVPAMIDEIPALALAASLAVGETRITGARELRVKESDRISSICEELARFGARVRPLEDGLVVEGVGTLRGAECFSHGDHRIAMMGVAAGSLATGATVVLETECVSTSFPGFVEAASAAGIKVVCVVSAGCDAGGREVFEPPA